MFILCLKRITYLKMYMHVMCVASVQQRCFYIWLCKMSCFVGYCQLIMRIIWHNIQQASCFKTLRVIISFVLFVWVFFWFFWRRGGNLPGFSRLWEIVFHPLNILINRLNFPIIFNTILKSGKGSSKFIFI